MYVRRSTSILAVVLGLFAPGCAGGASGSDTTEPTTDTTTGDETTTTHLRVPPPAEVLDAELVYFDPDGTDERIADPPDGLITDQAGLRAFQQRYVDGEPALDAAASQALAGRKVLIGGVVSSGCFPATRAVLGDISGDVRLIPVGVPDDDPEIACVRAVNSIALVAVDPAELPAGATVQGT